MKVLIVALVVLVIVLVNIYTRKHPLTPAEEEQLQKDMQTFQP